MSVLLLYVAKTFEMFDHNRRVNFWMYFSCVVHYINLKVIKNLVLFGFYVVIKVYFKNGLLKQ